MMSREELEGLQATLALCGRLIYRELDACEIAALAQIGMSDTAVYETNAPLYAQAGFARMGEWYRLCGGSLTPAHISALKREWLDLFVGLGKPKAPVWESYYTDPNCRMFGASTLEVRKAYQGFGLQVEHLHREPDDNLGTMLGFLSHLIGLELSLEEDGQDADWTVEELRAAQQDFLEHHVLTWIAAWRSAVYEAAPSDFYCGLADMTFGTVEAYASRFGIRFARDEMRFVVGAADKALA